MAAQNAYRLAGIEAKDIDVAEVHDDFTVGGVMALNDLGLYENGGKAFLDGDTKFDAGKIAVNTSGGLKAKGYPIGAAGVSQIAELYLQLTNRAGERQGSASHPQHVRRFSRAVSPRLMAIPVKC